MRKLILGASLALAASLAFAQSAIIRGIESDNSYSTLKATSGVLQTIVNSGSVSPSTATFTNATATVTNSSTTIVAANTARKYLAIQNNDSSGIVYINHTAASTTAIGIKLNPGQTWVPTVVPLNAITAIGSIASNANVVTVEGN